VVKQTVFIVRGRFRERCGGSDGGSLLQTGLSGFHGRFHGWNLPFSLFWQSVASLKPAARGPGFQVRNKTKAPAGVPPALDPSAMLDGSSPRSPSPLYGDRASLDRHWATSVRNVTAVRRGKSVHPILGRKRRGHSWSSAIIQRADGGEKAPPAKALKSEQNCSLPQTVP